MQWKKGMPALDLSALHDILVEDDEGNMQPMDQPYFKAKQIAPGTWQVLSDGDHSYVIEGDDERLRRGKYPGVLPIPGPRQAPHPALQHP